MSNTLERGTVKRKEKMRGRQESQPYWGEDRRVIIRPDVPGKDVDPMDSVPIRTDEELAVAQDVLDELYAEVAQRVRLRRAENESKVPERTDS